MILYKLMSICFVFFISNATEAESLLDSKGHDDYIQKVIDERLKILEEKLTSDFDFKLQRLKDEHDTQIERQRIMMENKISELTGVVRELVSKCGNNRKHTIDQPDLPNNITTEAFATNKTSNFREGNTDVTKRIKMPNRILHNRVMEHPVQRDTRLLLETITTEQNVAFYAYLSQSEVNAGPHHSLIFDHVDTNIGDSYNKHTGIFTAPMDGVYLLTYSVFKENHGYGSFEIVVNSASRGAIFVDSNSPPHNVLTGSTGVAVMHLTKGDACFIRTHSTYSGTGTIRSDHLMRTAFTGVKI